MSGYLKFGQFPPNAEILNLRLKDVGNYVEFVGLVKGINTPGMLQC